MEAVQMRVPFQLEHETYDLDAFQAGGHFVPGQVDAEQRRRPFEGNTVHVLVLKHMGSQVLRVVADSFDEAERVMSANIRDTLLALWTAQQSTQFSYDQMKRLVDRQGQFQAWIDQKYAREIAAGEHAQYADLFDVAMHYMRRE